LLINNNKYIIYDKKDFLTYYPYKISESIKYPEKYPCLMELNSIDCGLTGDNINIKFEYSFMNDLDSSYQGFHATADIILTDYPKDIVSIFKKSLNFSNLNIVAEKIHDFGGAVTAVFVLAESHATLHEYPENNYVTVDIYTCGKEGDPLRAIKEFMRNINVSKYKVNYLNRGLDLN
jgi:S-adenosylmethionine decarboxylase